MHSPTALTLSKWSSSLYPHAPYADHYQLKPALLQTIGIVVQSCLSYRVAQLSESIIYRMERRRFTVETCESRMTNTVRVVVVSGFPSRLRDQRNFINSFALRERLTVHCVNVRERPVAADPTHSRLSLLHYVHKAICKHRGIGKAITKS